MKQAAAQRARAKPVDPPEFTTRQSQILDQTLELIRGEGLAGLTMRKVAQRMGFTEPAVYRHFKTKQDLILGIIRRLEINLIAPMRVIAADNERPVIDRIGDITAHHLGLIAENNALPILLFAEAAVSPDERLGRAMAAVFGAYEELLTGLLREGRERGEIAAALDPADGAMILMGAPAACALRLRLLGRISTDARRRHLVQYIKSALLPPTEVQS